MGTSASFARKALLCLAAALLASTLVPASAFAWEEELIANPSVEEAQEADSARADEATGASTEADDSTSADSSVEAGTLAASLMGRPASFVNADVALDGEPVIGSFIVDGLTFAVIDGSTVELVGVSNPEASDSTPAGSATEADDPVLMLPESVAYSDVEYAVTSIGAYAFYLSGVTSVELPASVVDVDDRAFRSSDVASVTVADGNPTYSSFDGALYSADRSSLLLIPEGKQGAVLLPKETEVAEAGKFSHCSLVDAISAEDGAAFASENGLLYDASLTTLLRVPAGATEITIREGCTTIAAGAMEGCAKLATINAPASVASISPDIFTSVPTISLPAAALAEDAPQLSALVALSSVDDDLPEVDVEGLFFLLVDAIGRNAQDMSLEYDEAVGNEAASTLQSFSTSHVGTENDKMYFYGSGSLFIKSSSSTTPRDLSMDSPFLCAHSVNYWRYTGQSIVLNNINGTHTCGINSEATGISSLYRNTTPSLDTATKVAPMSSNASYSGNMYFWINPERTLSWDANGGTCDTNASTVMWGKTVEAPVPYRENYVFKGWFTEPEDGEKWCDGGTATPIIEEDMALYARWESIMVDFDTSSEPRDEDCPGEEKPAISVPDAVGDDGRVEIENPKRPGYVFQGWTIPNVEGTEAIDQKLVYQDETDGKWYVDASKLPDYVNDERRVELTARWTSVISVDVPSAVTFYADVVTQGNESREGAVDSAFGQNKMASQSQVDLRIVGLESTAVATQGSTLGADSILKKATSATPSSSTQKLFSLYPTDAAFTPDDLQDPDAVSVTKPTDAVDFALDDILLEKSFASDKFTIPAGDTLNLGYRLNLSETGTELDYEKLSTLDEGQYASIANISYCFAADALPFFWTHDDDGRMLSAYAIKDDAESIAQGDAATIAKYTDWMSADHRFYVRWFDKGVTEANARSEDDSTVYEARIIGINHDDKSDGSGKAGLTFQFVDCLTDAYRMNQGNVATGTWIGSELRARMNPGTSTVASGTDDDAIWNQVPGSLAGLIVQVDKTIWTGTAVWISPYQSAAVTSTTARSSDRIFLAPEAGMRRLDTYPRFDLYLKKSIFLEGGLYGYYDPIAPSGDVEWDIMAKRLGPGGKLTSWWCSSHSPNPANTSASFISIGSGGDSSHATTASTALGVCPAFCL